MSEEVDGGQSCGLRYWLTCSDLDVDSLPFAAVESEAVAASAEAPEASKLGKLGRAEGLRGL